MPKPRTKPRKSIPTFRSEDEERGVLGDGGYVRVLRVSAGDPRGVSESEAVHRDDLAAPPAMAP